MSVEVMRSVIDAAEGRVPVDTLFENARIVDVYGQRVVDGSVAVKGGVIVGVLVKGRDDAVGGYEARETVDCGGRYLAPGFIDGHPHGGYARHDNGDRRQPRDRERRRARRLAFHG